MVFIFIIFGAIVLGSLFESFQFAFLGAFLGFLLNKVIELSTKVAQLTLSLKKLQQQRLSKPSINDSVTEKPQPITPQPPSHSMAKMPNSNAAPQIKEDELDSKESVQPVFKTGPTSAVSSAALTETKSQGSHTDRVVETHQVAQPAKNSQHRKVAPPANDIISRGIRFVTAYFTEGNVVVRVGAVVLFFGIAFLLKYAAENSDIPMEFRLIGVAVGAIALLVFGWRLRNKQQGYGLILQGVAIGILYLTLFAGFRLYQLVPPGLSFILLILFSAFAMTLAVLQDSRALAVLSVMGGFLAPVLTSTGSGSHIGLFGYYSILNIGIFVVAWFKLWRPLNIVGFFFTFLISTAWGVTKYQPEDFLTTEPFLILFFLLYSAIALLFATKQKTSLKGYVDATLVFGLPLISFGLQAAMVKDLEFGLAWSSFALGGFYLFSAFMVLRMKSNSLKVIAEAYLALGIIFVSLVIPFALDGQWTAASWSIEGAGLVWIGLRQSRWFAKYFGALLQFVGAIIFVSNSKYKLYDESFFNAQTLGILFVAIAAIFTSYQIWIRKATLNKFESTSYLIFLIWGLLWWYLGGMMVFTEHLSIDIRTQGLVLFISLSGLGYFFLEKQYSWISLRHIPWVTLPLVVLLGIGHLTVNKHLLESWSAAVWLFTIASFYWTLFQRDQLSQNSAKSILPVSASNALHITGLLAVVTLSIVEVEWLGRYVELDNTPWAIGSIGILFAIWISLLGKNKVWPIRHYPLSYSKVGTLVLLGFSVLWVLLSYGYSASLTSFFGDISYIPFLNPLDITQSILTLVSIKAILHLKDVGININQAMLKRGMMIYIFIWLNIILFRSVHAWLGVPYHVDSLMSSFAVQTSLSIFWTIIGLAGTIYAAKSNSRKIWFYASGLIGVVVVKLFTVDLENSSSIERIISFVVVGLLLLIVGYFSPLPNKKNEEKEAVNTNDNK